MNKQKARLFLKKFYTKKGYRKIKKGSKTSHPGDEIRFSVSGKEENFSLKQALKSLGFSPGKAFKKHSKIIIPLYGKERVKNFFNLVNPRKK